MNQLFEFEEFEGAGMAGADGTAINAIRRTVLAETIYGIAAISAAILLLITAL
jgi:hypothetical protein